MVGRTVVPAEDTCTRQTFTRDTLGADAQPPLLDAFHRSATGHYGPTSSWTAFRAIEPGRRIDYVMTTADVRVLAHGTLPDSWDGRFPSDHLPVLARLAVGEPGRCAAG